MSFRKKMMLCGVVLVTIPTLLIGPYAGFKVKNGLKEIAHNSLIDTTDCVIEMLDDYFLVRVKMLRELSQSQAVLDLFVPGGEDDKQRVEKANTRLAEYARDYGDSTSVVFVANLTGRVIADNSGGKLKGKDISDRDVFKLAMRGRETIDDLARITSTIEMQNTFTIPIRIEGQVVGAISFVLNLKPIEAKIKKISFYITSGTVYLVDSRGRMCANSESRFSLPKGVLSLVGPGGIIESMSEGELHIQEYSGSYSDEVIAYGRIKKIGWGVAIVWDTSPFLSPAADIFIISFVFGLLFLLVANAVVTDLEERLTPQPNKPKANSSKKGVSKDRKQKSNHRVKFTSTDQKMKRWL